MATDPNVQEVLDASLLQTQESQRLTQEVSSKLKAIDDSKDNAILEMETKTNSAITTIDSKQAEIESSHTNKLVELDAAKESIPVEVAEQWEADKVGFKQTVVAEAVSETGVNAARAETAANVSTSTNNIFSTKADGEAAKVNGEFFWVLSGNENNTLELWLMGETVAADTGKRVASAPYLNALADAVYDSGQYVTDATDDIIDLFVTATTQKSLAHFDKKRKSFKFMGIPTNEDLKSLVTSNPAMRNSDIVGADYDFNDLSTLFQDEAGELPVTSVGQTVALVLDKSGQGRHLTLTDVTLGYSFGKYCLLFNGSTSRGNLPTDVLMGSESFYLSVSAEYHDNIREQFPVWFSGPGENSGSTRLGIGVYELGDTHIRVYCRALSEDAVSKEFIYPSEVNKPINMEVNIDYLNQTLLTRVNGEQSTTSDTWLNGVAVEDLPVGRALLGGFNQTPFNGKIYSLSMRNKKLSDVELEVTKAYVLSTIPKKEINVFLIGGQSNADGRAPAGAGPFHLRNNLVNGVKVWNGSQLTDYDLTDYGKDGNGSSWVRTQTDGNFSFVHVALKEMAEKIPNLTVCQVTSGGTSLAPRTFERGSWCPDVELIPDGTPRLLEDLENRFNALQSYCEENQIKLNVLGFLWHQGESDAPTPYAAAYADRFEKLINRVRKFTSCPRLPVFYGTVPVESISFNATVQQAHLNYAANDIDTYCTLTDGFSLLGDSLHFDANGCTTFGLDIANKIKHYLRIV